MFHWIVLLSLIASNAYGVAAILLNSTYLNQLGYNTSSTQIQLNARDITEIDWNAFKGYSKLVEVSLRNNQLSVLDIGVFRDSAGSSLKTLDLIGNPLYQLTNPLSYYFPLLSNLYLSRSSLTSLDPKVINQLPNLVSLDVGDQLSPLKANQLSTLKKLEVLTITTKNQGNLIKDHLNGIVSLGTLKFSSSGIKTIDADTLMVLPNLTHVDFSNNELTALDFLQFPSKVDIVVFQGNRLSSFKLCPTIAVVKYLDLSNNQFNSFKPLEFSYLADLEYLDLSNNPHSNPSEIASHMKYLVSIRTIKLSNLSISSIHSYFFENNPKINSITLSNNKISVLPYDVFTNSNAKYLQIIDLSNNQISFLDNRTFVGIDLYYLNLNNNKLTKLGPGAFYVSYNVYFNIFSFSNNLISEVDRFAFSGGSPGLQEIYLDGNKLTKLDDLTFAGCTKLRKIVLYNNPNLPKSNLANLCPKPVTSSCSVLF